MNYKNLIVSTEGTTQIITVHRPDKMNALNRETMSELNMAISQAGDDGNIRCIILTGAGEKAFVAGADIAEFQGFDAGKGMEMSLAGHNKVMDLIEQLSKPVIAAVNGFALGGGLELAMACHFRVAAESARFGLPEVSLGIIPGYGGTQRLPALAGKGKAFEMILTGDMISAEDALHWGIVNYVVSSTGLLDHAKKLASRVAMRSPVAVAAAIRAVNAHYLEPQQGYKREMEHFASCFDASDFEEGTAAFLEKRKPQFTGK